jgi:hypothetical protein
MKKADVTKILEENHIDPSKFEEYLRDELGLDAEKRITWSKITENDLRNLVASFQSQSTQQPKGHSQSVGSSHSEGDESVKSSESSAKSETHKISPDTPNKVTLLKQQTISFELLPEKDPNTGEHLIDGFRCVLNFGKERPPTIVPKSQGRHVSSYALFIETIQSRLEGKDIEEAIDMVEEIILEYIDESAKCVEQFKEYTQNRKLALKLTGIISKEDRKEIYQIEETKIPDEIAALKNNLETGLRHLDQNPHVKQHIEEALKRLLSIVELRNQKDEILPPLEMRNKVKRADLWKYQQCLVDTIKAGMVVLNRMDGVAFTGIEKKTPVELGSEGQGASVAMASLRKIDPGHASTENIVSQMIKLFDYPLEDIKTKARGDQKSDQDVVGEFYQVLRRHEKFCYDSFSGFRNLGETDRSQIRIRFLTEILKQEGGEWEKFLDNNDKSNKNLTSKLKRYKSGIELRSGSFKLKEKFQAKSYPSFTEAITRLENEIESLQESKIEVDSRAK